MGVFCYDKRDNVGFTWILTTQWGFGTTYPISFTQFNVVAFDAGDGDGQHVVYYGNPSWATLSGIEQFPTVIGFIVIGR